MMQRLGNRERRSADAGPRPSAAWRWTAAASVAVAATVAGLVYRQDLRHREALLLREGSHVIALEREFLSHELRAVHSDLLFLAQRPLLQRLLAGDTEARPALEREYAGFAQSKRFYDQVRFLDEQGRELVRVNRRGDTVEIVDERSLQSKSTRYYFREASWLEAGEVYVSPLDLNIERGEIERPLNPMIRLATPVVNPANGHRGLLVLNYAGARLLGMLRELAGTARGATMLVNMDGEYLQAPHPSRAWGWLLGHSSSFRGDHPEVWEGIRAEGQTQLRVGDDLFMAEWVPLSDDSGADQNAVAIVWRASMSEAAALKLGAGGVLALLGALVVVAVLAFYWARATAARRTQERRTAESEARLRVLSSQLLAAQEEERKSLSRVLHDELGQQVTAIALDLKAALRHIDESEPTLRRVVEETEGVLASLHQIAARIRPSVLDDLGLADAIESYVSEYEERTGVSVATELRLPPEGLSGPAAENVYRILQEALANVAAHAETDAARVEFIATPKTLELTIEDDGRGFDAATPNRSSRLGILGMRERVELLGGEFELETAPGQGTRIQVRLPRRDE
jgi:signal transduction histidine kinase